MSQPSSSDGGRGVLVQKTGTNVYTVMLILALLALIIGCVFLFLEIQEYGGPSAIKGLGSIPRLPSTAVAAYFS